MTYLVVSDWEQDEAACALDEKWLLLLWQVDFADEFAVELVCGMLLLAEDLLDRLALGEEGWL